MPCVDPPAAPAPVKPIERYETYPTKTVGEAAPPATCEDASCKAVLEGYRRLIFSPVGVAYTQAERGQLKWRDQLPDLLRSLAQWREPSSGDQVAFFAAKCAFYNDLAGMVVDPADRQTVFRDMLEFLTRSNLRTTNRMEWFLPINVLIGRSAMDPASYGRLFDDLMRSPDPIIALYAQLERLSPRPPGRIVPLL